MKTKEIINQLIAGNNFQNDSANWVSFCKPSENRFWIIVNDKNEFFSNINQAAKRIKQLINRGY